MTRTPVALALGAAAVLAVLVTAALTVTTYVGAEDDAPAPEALVVADPGTGARLEVPGETWEVRGQRSRIYYEDDRGRPIAVVTGPAVFRDGYCAEQPGDSNRGFAGFTEQTFAAWLEGLTAGRGAWTTGESREEVELADGTRATLRWAGLMGDEGTCAATGIEVAMVQAGDVRVVLVADSGDEDTLTHDGVRRILLTLRLDRRP